MHQFGASPGTTSTSTNTISPAQLSLPLIYQEDVSLEGFEYYEDNNFEGYNLLVHSAFLFIHFF